MFNLFKKKSPLEKLEAQYKSLLEEAYKLSTVDRKKSDLKTAAAEEILKQIESLKQRLK